MADGMLGLDSGRAALEAFAALMGQGASPGSWIGAGLVAGTGAAVTLTDPATGAPILSYAEAGAEVAARAAQAAEAGFKAWSSLTPAARGRALWAWGERVAAAAEPLARLEASVSGKPVRDCLREAAAVADMLRYWAGWTDKLEGRVVPVPTTHHVTVRHEPYGVILAITPWNAPLFTAGWNVAPILAAGNACILKPSEFTPLTSLAFAKLAVEAGVPEGVVTVVPGTGPVTGAALIAASQVAQVVFVGSPEAGAVIGAAAARRGIPAVLELGGKSANIVFDDADLDRAVTGAQAAIFAGCGQSCVAGSRLLVQRSVHARLVEAVAAGAGRIRLGHPLDPASEMGPIANARQHAKVTGMVAEGLAAGARLAAGGTAPPGLPGSGFWLSPTLLADVSPAMAIAQEEVFGPVLAAMPFDTEEEAIALANATRFGLAGAVWTSDVGRAHRVAAGVKAGTFWVNGYRTIHVSVPFGGFGASGIGRSSGIEALAAYTRTKAVWVETAAAPPIAFGYGPR
ncbi:MAG: aldehyde dehydrogenase family protein [Acetobacteraceae bacterium]|nr:aldehyde dehydrogenase family protein [Acetobacteraceae bacterium]